jgi:hypothetical protein
MIPLGKNRKRRTGSCEIPGRREEGGRRLPTWPAFLNGGVVGS